MLFRLQSILFLGITCQETNSCSTTNKLCITQNKVLNNQYLDIYYPANIFPSDINANTLLINLYKGHSDTLVNPCYPPTQLIKSFKVTLSTAVNKYVNSTTIYFGLDVDLPDIRHEQFFLQLRDPQSRQCLLGPDLGGVSATSFEITFPSTLIVSTSTHLLINTVIITNSTMPASIITDTIISDTLTITVTIPPSTGTNTNTNTNTNTDTNTNTNTDTGTTSNTDTSKELETRVLLFYLILISGIILLLLLSILICCLYFKRRQAQGIKTPRLQYRHSRQLKETRDSVLLVQNSGNWVSESVRVGKDAPQVTLSRFSSFYDLRNVSTYASSSSD